MGQGEHEDHPRITGLRLRGTVLASDEKAGRLGVHLIPLEGRRHTHFVDGVDRRQRKPSADRRERVPSEGQQLAKKMDGLEEKLDLADEVRGVRLQASWVLLAQRTVEEALG